MKLSNLNITMEQWMGLAIGLLLASVSATADWYTYYSINPSIGFMILGIAIVASLTMVKMLGAAFLIHTRGKRRIALIGLLTLLIGLSGATGTFFFKSILDGESSESVRKSYQYQEIQASINLIKKQQAAVTQQLAACPSGWKSNCINPMQRDIANLESKKNLLLAKLKVLPGESSTIEFWNGVSAAMGWSVDHLHWTVFGFISILIDVLSLAGFAIFGSPIPPLFLKKRTLHIERLKEEIKKNRQSSKKPHITTRNGTPNKWPQPEQLLEPVTMHHKKA